MPRPLRVLFAIPSLAGGGAERVALTLLAHLDRARFAPELAAATLSGPYAGQVPPDVPAHDLGSSRARGAVLRLAALVRRTRPDVLFTTLGHLNLLAMLARPLYGRPGPALVARETNIPSLNLGQSPYPGLFRLLYRLLYPRFDRVVCQSGDMRDDLVERFGVPADRARTIPNPVDADAVRSRAAAGRADLPPGRVNLVAAGKLLRQKGFDLLLEALALLPADRFHLTVLGQGPLRETLETQARHLGLAGRAVFAGFQENPYPWLAAADLFVLSSRYEGLPNVVLEALTLGTPVAAFRCPGGLDEIVADGVNGFLAEPGSPADLARAIRQAADAPPGRAAVAASAERYRAERIVREYEALLEEAAGVR
ncbi:MAG: glycosyltransferase [Thermodesulfobacteriota bacterium]